jgi:hypothetical protein
LYQNTPVISANARYPERLNCIFFCTILECSLAYSTHAITVETWGILLRLAGMNKLLQKKYFSEYHRKIQEKVSKKYKILYNMIQESAGWNIRPAKERRENGKIQFKK